jgi:hypothetical protein
MLLIGTHIYLRNEGAIKVLRNELSDEDKERAVCSIVGEGVFNNHCALCPPIYRLNSQS